MAFTDFGNQAAPTQQVASQQLVGPTVDRAGSEEEEKQGLLGRIMPFIQSMGMAAAFGANPLAGLLVGPQIIQKGRDLAKVGNEERRFQLQQRQRAEIARDRLPGLLQDPRQGQLAQSLLDIGNPQLTSGLLSSRTNTTTQKIEALQAEARRRGLNPEETNAFIDANMGGGNNPLEMILAELTRDKREQDIAGEIEDRAEETRQRQIEANSFANNLRTSAQNLIEASRINDQLEAGSGGASDLFTRQGLPGQEGRRNTGAVVAAGAELLGQGQFASDLEGRIGLVDDFNAIVPQIAIDRLDTEGFDAGTNARFSAFVQTKPTLEKVGSANRGTIVRNLKAVLLADEARGGVLSPEERQQIEAEIKRLELSRSVGDLNPDEIRSELGLE